jgi:hypothetical protein
MRHFIVYNPDQQMHSVNILTNFLYLNLRYIKYF